MDLEVLEELKDIFLFNIKDIVLQLWGSGFVNVVSLPVSHFTLMA